MKAVAHRRLLFLCAAASLVCWCMAAPALARELVSCRYLSATGIRIELELTVTAPPPATLIITQSLPPDVSVANSSPAVKKFSQRPGEAKWLIMGIRPGVTILSMTVSRPLQAGQLGGEMAYNDPVTGEMVRMAITP